MEVRNAWHGCTRIAISFLILLAIATFVHLIVSKTPNNAQMVTNVDTSNLRARYVQYLIDIPFTIEEPDVCSRIRPNASLLIYVHSAPDHFKNRAQIRRSYGSSLISQALGTVTVFIMGRSKDPVVERAVKLESARYRDIIMADYEDTYHNLTFKAVSALTWVVRHCQQVAYVLKTDDDIFINIFNVVRYVNSLIKYEMDNVSNGHIYCKILYTTEPMRNKNAKWYVSEEEYSQGNFPLYCSGSAYIMPSFVVPNLINSVPLVPFLWLDDVYVTGLLRNMTGTIELSRISTAAANTDEEYLSKSTMLNKDGLFGHISGDKGLDLREKYWKEILEIESKLNN